MENKPESGKQYALTGGSGEACIANGNSWAESEVPFVPGNIIKDLGGEHVIIGMGSCGLCNRRLYGYEDCPYPDPRGALGDNTASVFVSEDYNMEGPDVTVCWDCSNNNGAETYNLALSLAKNQWESKVQS